MKIALLALLATADLASGQCVQRAPRALLPATQVITPGLITPVATVFQPILVPAFSFQFVGGSGYTAAPPPLAPPAPGPTSPAPALTAEFWPEAVATTAARPDPVAAILRNNCARCHAFPNSRAGVHVVDGNGALWSGIDRVRVAQAIITGRMPPGGRLSQTEIATITNWATAR